VDGLTSVAAILAILAGLGGLAGLANRAAFKPGWLGVTLLLLLVDDALLTNAYGLLPGVLPGDLNWQGKGLALIALLAIAVHPLFGWQEVGLTLRQKPGSLRGCLPVAGLYLAIFLGLALAFPNEPASAEDLAFQLTMPGLEEELFYRGLLLFALNQALAGRVRLLGVEWGWGAALSSIAFGLAHAFSYGDGSWSFEPLYFALTAGPAMLAVWLRELSGSLLLPLIVHNAGNLIPHLL